MVNKSQSCLHLIGIAPREGRNSWENMLLHICQQVEISWKLAIETRKVTFYIFFIGAESALLPMLITKLLKKEVAVVLVGNPLKVSEVTKDSLGKIRLLRKIKLFFNLFLSNKILVYSENIIKERELEKFRSKVFLGHEHFVDLASFSVKKEIADRENIVGYIGRLSGEKGVLTFVEAIPAILKVRGDIKFIIGGDGDLKERVDQFLDKAGAKPKVTLSGWVSHESLPDYLNELKLLVMPSYTEGLPNIMLEAMACGTPVLATSVGAIPDIIKNGENGFIIEKNSPEYLTKKIPEILSRHDLDKISQNATKTIEKDFTYTSTVKSYKLALRDMLKR